MDLPSNKAAPNGANGEGAMGAYAAPSVPNVLWTLAVATRDPQEVARSVSLAMGSKPDKEMKLREAISRVKKRLAARSHLLNLYFIGTEVNSALYVADDQDAAVKRISDECGLSCEELEQCADVAHVFTEEGITYLLDHRATQDRPLSIAAIAEFARTAEVLAEARWSMGDLIHTLDDEWKKATVWALGADFETAMNALDALYLDLGARARKVLAAHELDKLPASSWRMGFAPR